MTRSTRLLSVFAATPLLTACALDAPDVPLTALDPPVESFEDLPGEVTEETPRTEWPTVEVVIPASPVEAWETRWLAGPGPTARGAGAYPTPSTAVRFEEAAGPEVVAAAAAPFRTLRDLLLVPLGVIDPPDCDLERLPPRAQPLGDRVPRRASATPPSAAPHPATPDAGGDGS